MILKFFSSKVHYFIEKGIREEFLFQELNNNFFTSFFGKMLSTGMLYEYKYDGKSNMLEMMTNIYVSVLSIYRIIYSPFLGKGVTLHITSTEKQSISVGESFIYRILIPTSNLHNNSYLNFEGIMLSGIDFSGYNFKYASFKGCLLIGCNFKDCNLSGADFSNANLSDADLRNAYIDSNTVFDGTIFDRTRIGRSHQQLFYKKNMDKFIID